ncbi:ligase-associated DNA damage response endonuclease PdeM [Aliiruegeria sabulilitoris]|uniref:ligase-associated DNA damage response endonuclease PdeM n=1 Tax=Aliiruegeria sabulilitoris TaxID=1510458 RepID=UPI00082DAB1E|nr:ligase-associated DNA damage response endonuclease PdeM [Aliiruegeria sabulilitoris]NDR55961.1 ligase-associated DNA damage response endonuclease PdeM [Pseudoruegeria sp. M32A2M]
MNKLTISFCGAALEPRPSGALWWPEARLLCVADLHLGKAERMARRGGGLLPPYECAETLERLDTEIEALSPEVVICLGDSFDDGPAAESLSEPHRLWIARLMAGRDWIWIAGNHDPAPLSLSGQHMGEFVQEPLTFRHIAKADSSPGEISGHFHPKARVGGVRRPCFLVDQHRMILPAFGAYTGGMDLSAPEIAGLMQGDARAILTGATQAVLPMVAA